MNNLKKNKYSQNGEDGIIEFLLSVLPKDNWCCEFGAWDGKYLSNTFNLVENKEYNAVYIESDSERFKDLIKTNKEYPKIVPINRLIDLNKNKLDKILSETNIPYDFDILSIDVDGIDYSIWKSLEKYQPKIVVIEINSSISPEIVLKGDELSLDSLYIRSGVNFKTCYDLAVDKGYTFMFHTGNMIFIDSKYRNLYKNVPNENEILLHFDSKWQLKR